MKVYLFFLLLVCTHISFAQTPVFESKRFSNTLQLNSTLQRSWYLSVTEIVGGYGHETDSNSFYSPQYKNQKILFTGDSINVFPDTTLRYYTGDIRNYKYKIESDSIYNADFIKVLSGNKRKQKELESYEIIKISHDELILKSFISLNTELDLVNFSIYYIYRRESVDSLLSMINGHWYHCSQDYRAFGFDSKDTTEIIFTRLKSDSVCNKNDNHIELKFHRRQYNNLCSIWSHTKYVGNGYEMNFMLDPEKSLLYMGNDEYIVYDILNLNQDELTISLNREKTDLYKKKNKTHNSK